MKKKPRNYAATDTTLINLRALKARVKSLGRRAWSALRWLASHMLIEAAWRIAPRSERADHERWLRLTQHVHDYFAETLKDSASTRTPGAHA